MKDDGQGANLQEAAKVLGIDVSTLQRNIKQGCPVLSLGSVGRGKGARVDVEAVRKWRASARGEILPFIENVIVSVFRDGVHERLKIHPGGVAYLLIKLYEAAHERVRDEPLVELPMEMRRLCGICLDWLESGQFNRENFAWTSSSEQ